MTLDGIKEAIEELPDSERISLAAWLNQHGSEAWDRQIESDFSEGGAGLPLLASWDDEIRAGDCQSLDEFLGGRGIS